MTSNVTFRDHTSPPRPTRTAVQHFTLTGVAPGVYQATFDRLEAVDSDQYGPGLRWAFRIAGGPHAGREVARVTAPTSTPRNSCGRMLGGVLGVPPNGDEQHDISPCLGRPYRITVAATGRDGASRIEDVQPLDMMPTPEAQGSALPPSSPDA